MAKLKCNKHGRRVHVLKGPKVLHREDGTHCESSSLSIGFIVHVRPEMVFNSVMCSMAKNPKPRVGQS